MASKTLGENEVIKGLGIDDVIYIPSNTELRNYDISRYTSSKELEFDVIIKEKVEPSSFTLNLYQLSGEKNLVDKTNVLTLVGTLNGTLRESSSVISPIITIEMDEVPNFNYVFIPNFNRYYFVTEITNVRNKLWNISLKVDVLMTYKDTIRSQSGIIARNEFDFNPLVEDTERLVEKDEEVEIIDIDSDNHYFEDGLNQSLRGVVVQYTPGKFK